MYICARGNGRDKLVRDSLGVKVPLISRQLRRRDNNLVPGRKRFAHAKPDTHKILVILLWPALRGLYAPDEPYPLRKFSRSAPSTELLEQKAGL